MTEALAKATRLPCWKGKVDPQPLGGGITNRNFTVDDGSKRYVVRIGDDIPVHGVMRFNELNASRAAHAAGLSPEIVYSEPGAMVMRFVEGKTLTEADVRDPGVLKRILPLIHCCHSEVMGKLRGPVLAFWVFQVNRDYAATLREGGSRMVGELSRLMHINDELETACQPVNVVFGHNDLLCGNFIDTGEKIWLIDWDYAGFNSPLFDLANVASNNDFAEEQERWLLETYFEAAVDDGLWRRYSAMKVGSLLRESMWSMVSEIHSDIDFDYVTYTEENLARFEAAHTAFSELT